MIRCHQCGELISGTHAKKCPRCGDTLKDEMLSKVRRKIRAKPSTITTILIIVVVALATCLAAEYASRMYSWQEKKTEAIVDKDTHTYTYTTTSNVGDDDNPIYITQWHTVTDYYFYLNKTGRKQVDANQYHQANVGDNYTYEVTHIDWKPGMKDAPIPLWVWIIPAGVLIGLASVQFYGNHVRRVGEMNEWIETGDLRVGEEE